MQAPKLAKERRVKPKLTCPVPIPKSNKELSQTSIQTHDLSTWDTSTINQVLEISYMIKDVHWQLLAAPKNPKAKAKFEILQISLKTTKDTMGEMDVAYTKKYKSLVKAKAHIRVYEKMVFHLSYQHGKEVSNQQQIEADRKKEQVEHESMHVM